MEINVPAFFDPKEIWRERLRKLRTEAARNHPGAGRLVARQFLEHIPLLRKTTIALYFPIGDELDTKPLGDALITDGHKITLPITPNKRGPLSFHSFEPGDTLVKGKFGIMSPTPESPALDPLIVITPLLGFSRHGARLGYGGGYYDRTLKILREKSTILAIGVGYAAQEVDALPSDKLDQRLDWIITEREAIEVAAKDR